MLIRPVLAIPFALLASGLLQGCSTNRQIAVDYPKTDTTPLKPLKSQSAVTGDDYYVQLISQFEFKGDNALKAGCSDIGSQYENSDLSAALVFNVQNDPLKFKREASGFLYQAGNGKCNFKLETKKAYLTPWLRLDSARDTSVDYNFLTSHSRETNLSQVVDDINSASNLLAITGVGTGVAMLGKVATNWVEKTPPTIAKTAPSAKYSSETHSLPSVVSLNGEGGNLNHSRLGVFEVIDAGLKAWASETKLLGELHVYPEITSSLLLKTGADGLPDAHDLSLEELWRSPMQGANGELSLKQLIEQTNKVNLQPDVQHYSELEGQCRQLKLVMKDLGFNKFDRNAVLYYFLSKSPDWKNFNISAQHAMTDSIRPKVLEEFHSKDFSGCLADEDYLAMKAMHLAVNSQQDWELLTNSRQKKEGAISPIQSAGRQLLSAVKNPDKDQMTHQLYPLFINDKAGNGSTLVQNHLSNFGLENLLQVPSIPDEGVVVNASQLATMFSGLGVEAYSCVRPAQDQGQPLSNIGIILFATKADSPKQKGGALEFELVQGKISRLTFQHPSFRDFEQNLSDYPDLGGCRIDAEFVNKLH